mmetsp:Transcript_39834/g.120312  ORF Transcript_39834/g.120312 Transcript_39834/m.120312 type:complete len:206 (-) Transcript_39834:349-966(-)
MAPPVNSAACVRRHPHAGAHWRRASAGRCQPHRRRHRGHMARGELQMPVAAASPQVRPRTWCGPYRTRTWCGRGRTSEQWNHHLPPSPACASGAAPAVGRAPRRAPRAARLAGHARRHHALRRARAQPGRPHRPATAGAPPPPPWRRTRARPPARRAAAPSYAAFAPTAPPVGRRATHPRKRTCRWALGQPGAAVPGAARRLAPA